MGVKHVATTANFSKFAAFSNYPLLDGFGLTDLFFLGGNESSSRLNHAPGGANLTVSGSPAYNAHSVTCGSAAAFVSSTRDTAPDTTLVGVFLPVSSASGAQVVGNMHGTLNESFALWTANTAALNLAGGGGASVDNTTSALLSTNRLFFAAAKFSGTTKSIVIGVDGALLEVGESFTRVRSATEPFRIAGDNYGSGVNADVTVGAVAIHKVALAGDALQALYDYFRWYYGQFGVDVA